VADWLGKYDNQGEAADEEKRADSAKPGSLAGGTQITLVAGLVVLALREKHLERRI
jgi:hypothetical protein